MYIYNCKHNNLRRFHDVLHVLKLSPFGLQTRLDGIGSPSENIINSIDINNYFQRGIRLVAC